MRDYMADLLYTCRNGSMSWSKTAQLILLFFILLSLQRFAAGDQIDYLVMNRSVSPRSLSVYSSDMILRGSRVICMHVD